MKILLSFKFAIQGIIDLVRHERNAQIELIATIVSISLGFYLGVSRTDWMIILFCIGMVLAAEAFNTALETLIDQLHPENHPQIGKAKDLAAAAVLIVALVAAVCGLLIFIPYL